MTMSKTATARRTGRPTTQDSQQKLQQVVTTAREEFVALGYRAVTMRGVAEKAQVSTRTLYNRYADKLSLFVACLDRGAAEVFPHLQAQPGMDLRPTLERYAADIVRSLSTDSSLQLALLVYREGGEFPELLQASEATYDRHLVQPLVAFFQEVGLESVEPKEQARLFIAMAISEWQRRVTYRHPLPRAAEIDRHARFVVQVFLDGILSSPPTAGVSSGRRTKRVSASNRAEHRAASD
jgi:AcrR family transcriptional regulator